MKTRAEKILALTRNELMFLVDAPEWLDEVAKFFADGGYHTKTDKDLDECYKFAIEEGVEP